MMANPMKGEVGFTAGGEQYALIYTINALVTLEQKLGVTTAQIGELLGANLSMGNLRTLFWAGLLERHDCTEEGAGELISEIGIQKAGLLGHAVVRATADIDGQWQTSRAAQLARNGTYVVTMTERLPDGTLYGVLSRTEILNAPRRRVVLVDHFEQHQAPEGIADAEILEIVDHHRVGTLETTQPIRVDCRPVGQAMAFPPHPTPCDSPALRPRTSSARCSRPPSPR